MPIADGRGRKILPIQLWYNSNVEVNQPKGGCMLMTVLLVTSLVTLSSLSLRLSLRLSNVNKLTQLITESVYILIQLSYRAISL